MAIDEPKLRMLQRSLETSDVRIVLTNTFDMSRYKLRCLGHNDDVCASLNRCAARLTRKASAEIGSERAVVGTIGAVGFRVSHAEAVNAYAEQAAALAEGGVDGLWLEGFSNEGDLEAALAGCAIGSAELPIIATVSTGDATVLKSMLLMLREQPNVIAVGVDGANGLPYFSQVIAAVGLTVPLVIKGNLNTLTQNAMTAPSLKVVWERFAQQAMQNGAHIIAGDEGCTPVELQAMSNVLKSEPMLASV